jgi:hypothetical protein
MRTVPDLDLLRGKAKTMSTDTITTRLTAFKALRDKAQTYADLLGMQQDAIGDQLATLTAKAQVLILDDSMDDGEQTADDALETDVAPLEQPRADHREAPSSVEEPPLG